MGIVAATLEGKHIYASMHPYNAVWKEILKNEIPGSAYDPEGLRWRFPLDLETCHALRKHLGKSLKVTNALADWASKEIRQRKELEALVNSNGAALRLVAEQSPLLHAAMSARPYQLVGAAWMAKCGASLLGDDPGLGKTLQVMGAVVEKQLAGPIIVFAPKTAALTTWPTELRKWLPDDHVTVVSHLDGQRRRQAINRYLKDARYWYENDERTWLICNFDMARIKVPKDPNDKKKTLKDSKGNVVKRIAFPSLFDGVKWQAAIVDESHNALITNTPQYWNQTQTRCGMGLLPVAKGGLKIAMSGTPMRGRIYNLWGTLNWLYPDVYTSFWDWCKKWVGASEGFFGGMEIDEEVIDDADNMAALYDSIRPIFLRRTKNEVAKDLPPKMYAGDRLDEQNPDSPPGIWLPLHPEQAKMYREMEKGGSAGLQNGTIFGLGVLSELGRMKQMACSSGKVEIWIDKEGEEHQKFVPRLPSNKFDWLVEWLEQRGICKGADGESKVVIASQYTDLLELFQSELERLGVASFLLSGRTSVKDRQTMATRWQEPGGPRVFFLNTKAGGVSLTLDAADDLIIIDETWIPDDQTQVEDRIHRVSRIHNVTIWYLRSEGTIEEKIAKVAGDRDQIQRKLVDGQRGVEFAKKLVSEAG